MEVEEFLKEAAVMKEIKHPNLVQLLGKEACLNDRCIPWPCHLQMLLPNHHGGSSKYKYTSANGGYFNQQALCSKIALEWYTWLA